MIFKIRNICIVLLIVFLFYKPVYVSFNSTHNLSFIDKYKHFNEVKLIKKSGWDYKSVDFYLTAKDFNIDKIFEIGSYEYNNLLENSGQSNFKKIFKVIKDSGYDFKTNSITKTNYTVNNNINEDNSFFKIFNLIIIDYHNTKSTVKLLSNLIFDEKTLKYSFIKYQLSNAQIHYFRNYLNSLIYDSIFSDENYTDLENFIIYNRRRIDLGLQPWKLMTPAQSLYHMQNKTGNNNMKFVSHNNTFELVFDSSTERLILDKINDGTYNYGYSKNAITHTILDVDPYFKFDNYFDIKSDNQNSLSNARNNIKVNYNQKQTSIKNIFDEMNMKKTP